MRMVESLIFIAFPLPALCSCFSTHLSPALLLYHPNKERSYFSYLWTYDFYGPVCAFDAGKSITRASRRGLGPGSQASAIWAQKSQDFQCPTPSHMPNQWICPHQKHYIQSFINQRSKGSFMYKSSHW